MVMFPIGRIHFPCGQSHITMENGFNLLSIQSSGYVNYSNLTVLSHCKGNYPNITKLFGLVNYSNLPRYIIITYIYICRYIYFINTSTITTTYTYTYTILTHELYYHIYIYYILYQPPMDSICIQTTRHQVRSPALFGPSSARAGPAPRKSCCCRGRGCQWAVV